MTTHPGHGIVKAAWYGTAVFTVSAVAGVFAKPARPGALIVALCLFVAGIVTFIAAYARAVSRSRTDAIAVTSLYFLAGSAPRDVRRNLLGALVAQVVVALAAAIARPYTIMAAGTLVPLYGLGLCGLWAARHGTFPPRPRPSDKTKRR